MSSKPILISGAGLASLLLARSLLRSSIPFIIFERDSSMSTRAQGYRLRLSSEGLDAIESVLGPEAFAQFWAACGKTGGGGFAELDAITGEKIEQPLQVEKTHDVGPKAPQETLTSRDGKIVGISRGEMRKQFMEGCEPYIKWGHTVSSYEVTESGVTAIFSDGSKSVEGAMLVGGDGISSKIAKIVSQGKLKVYDTGVRGIHGQARTTAFKGLGEGVWRMLDNSKGGLSVITNVRSGDMDDENEVFGWTMAGKPGVISAPNNNYSITGSAAANIAKELTASWHPRFRPLFESMLVEDAAFWKITCSTPSGVPVWHSNERVTVIGDAAHSMTPAGGIGANTAVRDVDLLGRLIAEAGGYAAGVTAAYEKEMRVYASEAVGISYGLGKQAFGFNLDENSPTV